MAITVAGTTITFNDGTVQSTAATGASTAFDGVGSYAIAHLAESGGLTSPGQRAWRARGHTTAGSNLRVNSRASGVSSIYNVEIAINGPMEPVTSAANNTFPTLNTTTLSGTWRLMHAGVFASANAGTYGAWEGTSWFPGLWVRIS